MKTGRVTPRPDTTRNRVRTQIVRRMLDPRHPTKLPRIKEALDVFGESLVVSVKEAA